MKTILCFLYFFSSLTAETVDELKFAICDALPEIWGWCSQEKALNFIDLVLEVKPKVCVEIGVFGGASLLPVASALNYLGEGIAVAIDPWDKIECIRYLDPDKNTKDLRWWAHQNMDHIYFGFLSLLRQFDLQKTVVIFRSTSKKAAKILGQIDILHIDGNHFEQVVTEDARLYLPKVREGGYIWLTDAHWMSAQGAVDLLLEGCDWIKTIDDGHCMLFKKR
ncbi:MAG: class I SAM-dependent methyltransferase [Chlamydiales bacterium]